jgi:hypothetical protein
MIWKASGMEDNELSAILKEIGESLRRAQALNLANNYLLAEIVRQLADSATNRHDYLVGMFERVGARAEQSPFEWRSDQINDLLRVELSKFFAQVARSPQAAADGGRPPAK